MRQPGRYADAETTAPTADAVDLGEAFDHLRLVRDLLTTGERRTVQRTLRAAIRFVQDETGRQLVNAVRETYLDRFPAGDEPLLLPRAPLVSVDEMRYYDAAGDLQTLDADAIAAAYDVDTADLPGWFAPIYGTTWPTTQPRRRAVAVQYTCGEGTAAADVDERAAAAVLLLLGHLWENREASIEANLKEIPLGVERLLEQLRYGGEWVDYGE